MIIESITFRCKLNKLSLNFMSPKKNIHEPPRAKEVQSGLKPEDNQCEGILSPVASKPPAFPLCSDELPGKEPAGLNCPFLFLRRPTLIPFNPMRNEG